jgi:anti-sigma factor ChrR (cupin superfamily)
MSTRTSSPGLNPVQLGAIAVHKTFEQLGQHINGVVQSVHCRIDAGMRELAHATSAAVHHFNAELASVGQAQAPHSLPAFAVCF